MHLTKNVEKARRLHRPSLKNWECDGLYYKFPAFLEHIENRDKYESFILNQRSSNSENNNHTENKKGEENKNMATSSSNSKEDMINIPMVINANTTTPEQFIEFYESRKVPTVIGGIPNGHGYDGSSESRNKDCWPALKKWKIENLESNPDINSRYFKVGEDDDGETVKL